MYICMYTRICANIYIYRHIYICTCCPNVNITIPIVIPLLVHSCYVINKFSICAMSMIY